MSFIDAQIEELRRKCTFCLAGRGFDSDQGRATRVTSEQIGFYLAHVAFEMSLARIASAAGVSRDVVAKACHVVEDRRDHIEFDAIMDACVQSLQQLPAHNALFQKEQA